MISQQTLEERKADRELFKHLRAISKEVGKETKGMTPEQSAAYTHNSVREFLIENGYTLKYADGTTIP